MIDASADVARCTECGSPLSVRMVESVGTGMSPVRTVRRQFYCATCDPARRFEERCESIPPALRWSRLGAPELDERVGRHARDLVAERLPDILRSRCVFLGKAGSGKSSLAAACFRKALIDDYARGLFALAWRLGLARAKHPLGHGDPPELLEAVAAPLLVLDDVGTEPGAVPNPVAECIFERHAAALPTWVTTGLSDVQIASRYGDGIARRIFEGAIVIDCESA